MRGCSDCGEQFEAAGKRELCDDCRLQHRREAKRKWKQAHPEHLRLEVERQSERRRAYGREYMRARYAKEPDLLQGRCRASYAKFRDKRIAGVRRYKRENRAKVIAWRRRYYAENREPLIAEAVEYGRRTGRSLEQTRLRRARLAGVEGAFTKDEFEELCESFGRCCAYCGDADSALTADHVVPLSKGGSNYIENILPACAGCNSSKGADDLNLFLAPREQEAVAA